MKTKNYLLLILFFSIHTIFSQTELKIHSLKTFEGNKKFGPVDKSIKKTQKLAPTITPSAQSICTGQAITNITATPNISDTSELDCIGATSGSFANLINNGIFFDITNSGSVPLRINGMQFVTVSNIATTANTIVPFAFYKTTSSNTAVGNYTNSSAWTLIGTYNFELPPSGAAAALVLETIFNDNGFTLPAGGSIGFYISCNNADTNGFRLAYRPAANSATPISNTDITVTHRVRSTGLFQTDNGIRGFYGKVLYNTGTFGYWSRNNLSNITGSTNAGDQISGNVPFPISGSLTNNSNTAEIATYTVTSYDVNGIKDVQSIYITVEPTPDNAVTLSGNTFTALQAGASYQWFRCDPIETLITGATNQSFTPTESAGLYKVRIINGPCEIESSCMGALSNPSNDISEKVKLYPIPARETLKILSEVSFHGEIINSIGQIVQKIEISDHLENSFNISTLKKGVYFLRGNTNDGKKIRKKIILD